jgi:hypothetical protein
MFSTILNWLAKRQGAVLAPVLMAAIASACTWAATKVPILAPVLSSPDTQLALTGFILAAGMSLVNYLTTARAFKYAEPVQAFLNTAAAKLGLGFIVEDGVIAAVSADKAAQLNEKLTMPGGPFNPAADVKPPAT